MNPTAAEVAAEIAGMTVTGVTILDLDEIPELADLRGGPVLFPDLSAWGGEMFISPGNVTRGPTAYFEGTRDFGFIYLHEVAGAGRGIADYTIAISDNRDAILEALCELTDIQVEGAKTGAIGTVQDINGNQYFGFLLTVTVWMQINP